MYKVEGNVGRFVTHHLRNAVDQLNLDGAGIELWVGRGIFSRPFVAKGKKSEPLERLNAWLSEVARSEERG